MINPGPIKVKYARAVTHYLSTLKNETPKKEVEKASTQCKAALEELLNAGLTTQNVFYIKKCHLCPLIISSEECFKRIEKNEC
jgi:hypothetical protein